MVRFLRSIAVLTLLLLPFAAVAQNGSLVGKVTDSSTGEILPGATVIITELTKGAATGIDGNYALLNIPPGDFTLQVSFVGYKNAKFDITIRSGENNFNVELEPDFLGLDEVVVTGTGVETSKKKLGINVSSVNSDDLTEAPALTIDAALAGKVAGAQISQVSGQPGRSASILLRGINTINTSQQPMILIDGVQINTDENGLGGNNVSSRLADIDFSDVERVEVVKGAAASTIYGAQGANGVIQIFTKKGKAGRTKVTFSTTVGFDDFTNKLDQIDRHFFATNADGTIQGFAQNTATGQYTLPSYPAIDGTTVADKPFVEQTFDGYDAVFRTGTLERYNLSVSGGNDKITYLGSANFQFQDGIEKNTFNDRYSLRFNTGIKLRDDLTADIRTNFVNIRNRGTISGNNISGPLSNVIFNIPFMNLEAQTEDGIPTPTLIEGDNSTNPLFLWSVRRQANENIRSINSLNLNYKPLKFLELDYKLGIDHYRFDYQEIQDNFEQIANAGIARLTPAEGYNSQYSDKSTTMNSIANAFLRFDAGQFNFQTQLSFDLRRELYERVTTYGQGIPTFLNSLGNTSTPIVDDFIQEFITYGYLLNQKVEIGEYAGFSFGGRIDYSSAFGEAQDPQFFPRFDGYLRLSQLGFWEPLQNSLTEFKLRGAYGQAGVQPGAFDRIITLSTTVIGDQGTLFSPTTVANPGIGVEVSSEFELGTDFTINTGLGFLETLNFSYTYWDRLTEGAIFNLDVQPSIGAGSRLDNSIDIGSSGFDFQFQGIVLNTKDVNWMTTVNLGRAVTVIEDIANNEDIVVADNYLLREGERLGVFFGFKALRSVDEVDADGNRYIPASDVGNFVLVDGVVVNQETKQIQFRSNQEQIGDPTPDFTLGFRNDFSIKRNLNIGLQFDWVQGFDLYNKTKQWMFRDYVHPDIANEVTVGNETGAFVNYYLSQYKTNDNNEFFVEDGSFIRLRELSITYDIAPLLKLSAIDSWKVGFVGRNLLTFTNYSGFDPEASLNGANALQRGWDEFVYPNFRTVSFTTSISF